MWRTRRSRRRSSSAICTSSGVLPTPAAPPTTPRFPRPSPPWIDFSKTRIGLRSFTSLRYIASPSLGLLGQLLAVLLDELLCDRPWKGSIPRELHGELGFALRGRAEDGGEAEHLGQRH